MDIRRSHWSIYCARSTWITLPMITTSLSVPEISLENVSLYISSQWARIMYDPLICTHNKGVIVCYSQIIHPLGARHHLPARHHPFRPICPYPIHTQLDLTNRQAAC